MFLAAKEIMRSKVRFGGLVIAVGLLMYLILVQQALAGALVLSFNGAITSQTAPILVYSTEALRAPQGSVITPQLRAQVEESDAVSRTGDIGLSTVTLENSSTSPSEPITTTLWGYEDSTLGGPGTLTEGALPTSANEAVGSTSSFTLGEIVSVVESSGVRQIKIVGLVADSQISVTPTLFMPWKTYEEVVKANNPRIQTVLPNLLGVQPASSEQETITALQNLSNDLDPLTKTEAAANFPGAAQVKQSFLIILGLFGVVVPLITGLFFLITTLQKTRSLTLLRAVGSRVGVLVTSVMAQVLFVLGLGIGLGVGFYALTTLIPIGSLQIRFDWPTVFGWTLLVTALSLMAALGSVRRVLAIDPVTATRTGGTT